MPSSDIIHEFDTIEDTIAAFKNGEFIIVLDSTSRENEGDLIISASDMTPEKMAFMMVSDNEDPNRTAYTISIDANHPSTTTGISAHDRSLACTMLADAKSGPQNFRRPGHVFPLRAREGGVRERPGHTEAAVDFCKLAGKPPVGVICEIVEDGEEVVGQAIRKEPGMLRRDGCLAFGKKWGLKTCTIEALVEYMEEKEGKWVKDGEQRNGNGV
ncbi:3,4-dihydroxy-2-butanone 4-phosphate synthase [Botrytis cinerea]